MASDKAVRFARVHGRVIPIKEKTAQPSKNKSFVENLKKIKSGAKTGAELGAGLYGASQLFRIGTQTRALLKAQKAGIRTVGSPRVPTPIEALKGYAKGAAIGSVVGATASYLSLKFKKKKSGV